LLAGGAAKERARIVVAGWHRTTENKSLICISLGVGSGKAKGVATQHLERHTHAMGRERSEQILPDLFSMDAVRDASPPQQATADATAEPKSQRHVLPKNLRNAVKHLSDGELNLLHTATFQELKRRGRLPPNVGADAEQSSRRPLNLLTKRLPPTDKTSHRRQADFPQVSLTRGQINAVRAAFKAGITLSRIARQFGISQSNVRKALATDEPKG
jgi:hypothetical protein